MTTVTIDSKQPNVAVQGRNFKYDFTHGPQEVLKEHATLILKNPNFFESGQLKATPGNTTELWAKELEKLPVIGKKIAADIVKVYPDKAALKKALALLNPLPGFNESINKVLKDAYGG